METTMITEGEERLFTVANKEPILALLKAWRECARIATRMTHLYPESFEGRYHWIAEIQEGAGPTLKVRLSDIDSNRKKRMRDYLKDLRERIAAYPVQQA